MTESIIHLMVKCFSTGVCVIWQYHNSTEYIVLLYRVHSGGHINIETELPKHVEVRPDNPQQAGCI